MFDDAQSFVEESMRTNLYPLFLNSDVYVQYVQNGGESPKSSLSTSGSSSARPMSTTLCTLHENSELRHEDLQADDLTFSSINQSTASNPSTVLSLNSTNLVATQVARNPSAGRLRVPPRERYAPATTNPCPCVVHPHACTRLVSCRPSLYGPNQRLPLYHYSYVPVSERDSENTSDAHTDDAMSAHTDSSM